LRFVDAKHLFPSRPVHVGVKREGSLSDVAVKFIQILAPDVGSALSQLR
jgi:hypothetical protein